MVLRLKHLKLLFVGSLILCLFLLIRELDVTSKATQKLETSITKTPANTTLSTEPQVPSPLASPEPPSPPPKEPTPTPPSKEPPPAQPSQDPPPTPPSKESTPTPPSKEPPSARPSQDPPPLPLSSAKCLVYYQNLFGYGLPKEGAFENSWLLDDLLLEVRKHCEFISIPVGESLTNSTRIEEFHKASKTYNRISLILLWSYRSKRNLEPIVQHLKQANSHYPFTSIGALHISDEYTGLNEVSIYPYVDFVFKSYHFSPNSPYSPQFDHKMTCLPLGFKPQFGPTDIMPNFTVIQNVNKSKLASYYGTKKEKTRYQIAADWLNNTKGNFSEFKDKEVVVKHTQGWSEDLFQSTENYRNAMRDSIFVLCPYGNHPETYRLSEALEAGSIPLVRMKKEHFCDKWNELPAPKFDTWDEAPSVLEEVLKKGYGEVDRIQGECYEFWMRWKKELRGGILNKVLTKFERHRNETQNTL